ncbi:hypothetical protein GCM10007972_08920 [Iodidimonas muriae]|uniref:Heme exporter protein D n=1 Tax=Iodidimonas muriae TaxID=261467 RepID=A0ABQ2LAI6_9PROT|nr:heme exporter protein CcmD [Iodidimonas muriae]GER06163.1 hypothetical protein JCM17843_04730 [Kordiimonadales bacterium JCM 17843]GGO08497.1 hypothetical protein GCM10007972_08920 [Iodidimonas muriae]
MNDFLSMGGYGAYIWACYGLVLIVLLGLGIVSWRTQKTRSHRADALKAAQPRRRPGATLGTSSKVQP